MEEDNLKIKHIRAIPEKVDGYPTPSPPKGRKTEVFDINQYADIDKRAEQAPHDIAITWKGLFSYLFENLTTDLQKVRALFSWFFEAYRTDPSDFTEEAPAGSPYALLEELAYLRRHYYRCLYFAHLCRQAGLPCVVLNGYSKEVTSYSVGEKDVDNFEWTWTSVYIDGSWRLIEPCVHSLAIVDMSSDFEEIEICGQAVRERDEGQGLYMGYMRKDEDSFLADPDINICVKIPKDKDKAWQLLSEPWSLDKFLDKPLFTFSYLESAWHLAAKHKSIVEAPGGICCISFEEVPNKSDFRYRLYFNKRMSKEKMPKELQLDRYVLSPNRTSVHTRLPVTGVYKLEMLDKDDSLLSALRIDSTGKINNQRRFPDIPEGGLGYNEEAMATGLVDPSREDGMVIAREGEKVCFKFRTKKPLEIQARLVHSTLASQLMDSHVTQGQEDDILTVVVKVPFEAQNPEFSLQINAREKDSDDPFKNVVNYLLTPDKELVYAEKGREQQVRDELSAAIAGEDLYRLERAIEEYRIMNIKEKKSDIPAEAYPKLCRLHQEAIQNATTSQNEEKLDTALKEADKSKAAYMIHHTDVYEQGQNALRRLRRLARSRREVKEMSGRQVSEVQSYNHPDPRVRSTIEATFILLGENVKRVKEWNRVQGLLRRHGKEGIIYRIQNHDPGTVDTDRIKRAITLLDTTTAEEVRSLSICAAAFYNWSKAVVDSHEQANNDQNATISQQEHEEPEPERNKETSSNKDNNNNNSKQVPQQRQ